MRGRPRQRRAHDDRFAARLHARPRAARPARVVGLSKIREKDQFGGLPIAEQYGDDERQCGVCVVDLDSGNLVAFLYFEAGTAEIFDLCALPGMRWPAVVGFQGEMLDGVMVAPTEVWAKGVELPIPPKRDA